MELISLNGPEEEDAAAPQNLTEYLELVKLRMQGKLYKDALKLLIQALKLDRPKVEKLLKSRLQSSIQVSEWEQALVWGNAPYRVNDKDPDLANQMGNCARQLDKYTLANNYYRHGLKSDPKHQALRWNLAASLAKTHRYNEEVHQALALFDGLHPPYMPDYVGQGRFITKLEEEEELTFEQLQTEILRRYEGLELPEEDRLDDELAEKLYNYTLFSIKHQKGEEVEPYIHRLIEEHHCFNGLELLEAYAKCYQGDCEQENQITFIKKYLADKPKNRYLIVNLGLLYREVGNWLQSARFLLIGVDLLEHSQGLFGIAEQIEIADREFDSEDWEKALNFYQVVAEQEDRAHVFQRIGETSLKLERSEESLEAWLNLKQKFSHLQSTEEQLHIAYEQFAQVAEGLRGKGKSGDAADIYEMAIQLQRKAEAFKALSHLYNLAKNKDKAYDYEQEYLVLHKEQEEAEMMEKREKLVALGRAMIKNKKYNEALDFLKQAFLLKKDKDVFVLQAYLLKSLKRPKALSELMASWKGATDESVQE